LLSEVRNEGAAINHKFRKAGCWSKHQLTEVLFYHLQHQPLERVLPALIERSLERGWRVIVQSSSDERVDALDAHLWTFRDDSFLPHGTSRESTAGEQPVLLTVNADNPNGASVRFLLDGVAIPEDLTPYQRVVLLFDGEDPDALVTARQHWRAAKERGLDVTYWQADAQGRWQRKTNG
jgi:DNA polymerase III subunit chi